MKNLTIKLKLIIIVVSTILVVAMTMFFISVNTVEHVSEERIEYYENEAYEAKLRSLKDILSLVMKSTQKTYEEYKSGKLTEDEAKNKVLEYITNIRYGDNNYFWVKSLDLVMLAHPKASLVGKDVSGVKDPNGKELFIDMQRVAKEKGKGTTQYVWAKPGVDHNVAKYTYLEVFKPWGWIIATGSYVDDVEENVNIMRKESESDINYVIIEILVIVGALIAILAAVALYLANRMIIKPIHLLTGTVKALTKYKSADQKFHHPFRC